MLAQFAEAMGRSGFEAAALAQALSDDGFGQVSEDHGGWSHNSVLECAGKAQRRRRFGLRPNLGRSQSGVALRLPRLPPHCSKSRRQFPDARRALVGRRRHPLAVATEDSTRHLASVLERFAQGPARARVPQPDCAIIRGGNDALAVGTEPRMGHASKMAQRLRHGAPGQGVPDARSRVARSRHDQRAISTKTGIPDKRLVEKGRGESRSRGRVPDSRRAVF